MSNRYVVRYGVMRTLGVFTTSRGETLARGNRVVARTERGLEVGEVLLEATEGVVERMTDPRRGQVLRVMTTEDERESKRLLERQQREFESCKQHIAALKLPMELVDVEQMFGGERIVVYYISENRVDFRDLVKVLANEFQTRIEMRQIGVRDEAKLLADYGDCGKPVCCNTHLSEMPPVSMKMAKLQKATLDPTKISGRCGRLKCCLRYEYDTYEELQKEMPPVGAEALTRDGRVRILAQEILAGQLLVETEDRRRVLINAADVLSVVAGGKRGNGGGGPSGGTPAGPSEPSSKPRTSSKDRAAGDRPAKDNLSNDRTSNERSTEDRSSVAGGGAEASARDLATGETPTGEAPQQRAPKESPPGDDPSPGAPETS